MSNKARPCELLMPVACVSHLTKGLVAVQRLRKPKSERTPHQENQMVNVCPYTPLSSTICSMWFFFIIFLLWHLQSCFLAVVNLHWKVATLQFRYEKDTNLGWWNFLAWCQVAACDWLLSSTSVFPLYSYWQPVANDLQCLDSSPQKNKV